MIDNELENTTWQNWAAFGLLALFLIGHSIAIYLSRSQGVVGTVTVDDLFLPFGVGVFVMSGIAVTNLITPARQFAPYIMTIGCWVLAVIYLNIVELTNPVFIISIMTSLSLIGLLRLGSGWGSLHALGVILATIGALIFTIGLEQLNNQVFDIYLLPFVISLIAILIVGGWMYAFSEYDTTTQLTRTIRSRAQQLDDMRERARTISEMTNALIGTQKVDKILEATLNIGQLSLRKKAKRRLVGLVLLVRSYDEALYIAKTSGLRSIDKDRVIRGEKGIVGRTLDESVPVIGENPADDPELKALGVFIGIRSVLCIPLRAQYENYGILIFGSEEYNAFNEDHIDTLYSITVQATVALQNAMLYDSLMREKERIIEMEEDARKALVRDLHDIPTQTISAVAMRLSIVRRQIQVDPQSVPEELQNIENLTRETIDQIRHVLFTLRPLALEDQGLAAALEQLAEKTLKTHGQPVKVRVGPDVEDYLDDNQQGALFYLVEEAVNNARKYASASLVTVQLARKDDVLFVRIADNGKGFDVDAANSNEKGSFGMVNMRERAELLDGTLTIKSARGQGTVITVVIPLNLDRRLNNNRGQTQMPPTKLAVSAQKMIERM